GSGIENLQLFPERACRFLQLSQSVTRILRVYERGDQGCLGKQLVQQPQSLRLQLSGKEAHAAARPTEAGDEAELDRIRAAAEDDGDGRGCCLGGNRGEAVAHDDRHLTAHKISRQCRESIHLILCPAELNGDVLTLDVASFFQAIAECSYPRLKRVGCRAVKVSD